MSFRIRYENSELELPEGDFTLGRSSDCDLALRDPIASRRHAKLYVDGERITIEDLGSSNGVFVNDMRIQGLRELVPGDRIGIGREELTVLESSGEGATADRPTRRPPPRSVVDGSDTRMVAPIVACLSPREHEVLRLVAHGFTHREAADRMKLSVKTVEAYRANIAHKLDIKTRAELVQLALDAGILGELGKLADET